MSGTLDQLREDARTTLEVVGKLVRELRASGLVPPTPAAAHALQVQAERDRREFAWLHHCGVLNHGYWSPGSMCTGCRFSVDKAGHVDAHYRLVPVEALSDEEQG